MLHLFDNYAVDSDRRELRRDGGLVPVEPQVFDLLRFLLDNRDRVVSKDDLLASVWGGRIVSESTLFSRINAARRVIGDNGEEQRLIRTIVGKGVRFVGEVRELPKPAELSEGRRAGEGDLRDEPAIVVLPIANLSADLNQNYVAAGLFEEIVTALSRYPSLFVVACADKGRAADVTQVAPELHARYIVNGSMRKGVDRIRVTARLIEADTGRHLWAERYDRDLTTISALDDGIAEAVALATASAVAEAERQSAMRPPSDGCDVWSAYQRGLLRFGKFSSQDNALAQRFFRQAIELDRRFSEGYRRLALSQVQAAGVYQIRELDEILRSAEAFARQAVTLAGRDSGARALASTVLWMRGDGENTLAKAKRALEFESEPGPNPRRPRLSPDPLRTTKGRDRRDRAVRNRANGHPSAAGELRVCPPRT